jgi:hypothetical protein
VWLEVVVQKSCDGFIGNQRNTAAVSTVSAVWATEWLEFLSVHRNAAIATISGANVQSHLIYEADHWCLLSFAAASRREVLLRYEM